MSSPWKKRIEKAKKLREKHGMIDMIMKPDGPERIERDDFGGELLTIGAAMWMNAFCTVLMKRGLVREAYWEGDPVNLWIRNLEGALSFAKIPNEAINARDYDWILRRFMAAPAAKHAIMLERSLNGP